MNKSMKDLVADARSRVDGIAPADAHRAMAQGDVILDVRETAELKSDGAIEGRPIGPLALGWPGHLLG